MKRLLILFLLSASPAFAAGPYYIDCAAGSDAANGTSSVTPWKHDPMFTVPTFTGTYSHANGDTFYFKGGVTCSPTAAWNITTGGAGGNPDIRTSLATWGTGTTAGDVTTNGLEVYYYGDWTHTGQPFVILSNAWNGKAITINSVGYTISSCANQWHCTLTSSAGVQSSPVSYSVTGAFALPIIDYSGTAAWTTSAVAITASNNKFDSMEFKNWSTANPANFAQSMFKAFGAFTGVTISNNHIHDWGVTGCTGDCSPDGNGDGISGGSGSDVLAQGNTMHARQDTGVVCQKASPPNTLYCSTGNGMYSVNTAIGNFMYDMFAYIHAPLIAHDNTLFWMNSGEDNQVHENGIYCFASCSAYNNVLHDFVGVPAIYWETYNGAGTVPSTVNVYGNILWNASSPLLSEPDRAPAGGPYLDVQNIWNNTIYVPGGNCVRTTPRSTNSGVWNIANNHCICDQVYSTCYISANSTTFNIDASSIAQTVANATSQGYTASQLPFAFAPTLSSNITVTTAADNIVANCAGNPGLCLDTTYGGFRIGLVRPPFQIGAYSLVTAVTPPAAVPLLLGITYPSPGKILVTLSNATACAKTCKILLTCQTDCGPTYSGSVQ